MGVAALPKRSLENGPLLRFVSGVALTLIGVLVVEALVVLGPRPLSPVSWPGFALLVAVALGGAPALIGGSLVVVGYYVANLASPDRFPEFFASPHARAGWLIALAVGSIALLLARPRFLRLAAVETELQARRRYEEALRESEERLRVIADNLPAFIAYIDKDERYRFNNRAYENWLNIPREKLLGRTVREVWGEERYKLFARSIERALRGERGALEYTLSEGGAERHVLASYRPDLDDAGRVKGFFVLGSDITQLAAARRELAAANERLEAALDGSSIAMWDTDLKTGRVYLSDGWSVMLGGPPQETVSTVGELLRFVHVDDIESTRQMSLEVMKGRLAIYAMEHRVRALNGDWKWILSRGRVTERDPVTGRALRMIGTNVDITDRKRIEEAIQSAAHTDPLTGLANRVLFLDRLRVALTRSRRNGTRLAVLYLDLDRFKEVNDSLGHAAGDALLRDFAMRLRSCVRASDTVARFGGDEFLVLIEELKETQDAARVAEKVIEESRRPVSIEGRELTVTASVGIAVSTGESADDALLKRADAALYAAKAAGRSVYRVAD